MPDATSRLAGRFLPFLGRMVPRVRKAAPYIAAGFLALAVLVALQQLSAWPEGSLRDAFDSLDPDSLLTAGLLTAAAYVALCFGERLSLRYAQARVSPLRSTLAGFVSFAVSHNAGHALLSGSSMRYRIYGAWGLSGKQAVIATVAGTMTYALGLFTVALAAWPLAANLPGMATYALPVIAAGMAVYVACSALGRPCVRIGGENLRLPPARITLGQMLCGSIDVLCSGGVLYVLLPDAPPIATFYLIYVACLLLGSASQIPGGLGVFEGSFLHFASAGRDDAEMLAALLLFRLICYCGPLALAGPLLLGFETVHRRRAAALPEPAWSAG